MSALESRLCPLLAQSGHSTTNFRFWPNSGHQQSVAALLATRRISIVSECLCKPCCPSALGGVPLLLIGTARCNRRDRESPGQSPVLTLRPSCRHSHNACCFCTRAAF